MRRSWQAGTVMIALAAAVAAARGDEGSAPEATVAVVWSSREGCLDGAAAEAAVRARTRRTVRPAAEADAIIAGAAAARAGGWSVEIVVTDRRRREELGRRALEVRGDCAALRDHVALVMAMLADSSVVDPAAVPPAPARDAELPPGASIDALRRWRVEVAAGGAGEAGRLPGATPGVAVAVGAVTPGGWGIELRGAAFAAAHAEADVGESELRWSAAGLVGCAPGWGAGVARATACGGVELGAVSAEGSGFARNLDQRELLVDGLLVARGELAVGGPVFVRLDAGLHAAARRPRFVYEDESGELRGLYRPRLVGATAALQLGARF
ncbi:MAG TPA: hypothetical protein VMZ28_14950 [Kofleriaceae bacterium]|nr:hypothetical protein [Kofleriaceae bacterium]